jgi:hypothetical protein
MIGSLSDRYIAVTLRELPEDQRAEVERELRVAIAANIEVRVATGETPTDAEYAALRDLGAPMVLLAAQYARAPSALIGQRLYCDWVRVVRSTCATVLPIVLVVLVIVRAAHHDNIWAVIFPPLGITLTVAMYLLVGVTALFALIDRHDEQGLAVDPDQLGHPTNSPPPTMR